MKEYPLVSLLVPMYNSGRYIAKTLTYIQNQDYPNYEIVMLDDGSSDGTAEIVNEASKSDDRIKFYTKKNEGSVAISRNYLLDRVNGEYFVFVDSDDVVSPTFLSNLVEGAIQTGADVTCCDYTLNRLHLSKSKKIKKLSVRGDTSNILTDSIMNKKSNYMVWNKLIKSSLLEKTRFVPSLHFGEDFVYIFDLYQNDLKVAFMKNKLYYYRYANNGISKGRINKRKIEFLEKLIEMEHDDKYLNHRSVLTSWIYVTAGLYLYITPRKGEWKDTRLKLKDYMRERREHYKQDKRVPKMFRIILKFIRL